jgi:predicted nucleic acid-binding protein
MNGVFVDSNIFLKILEGDVTIKNSLLTLALENNLFRNTIVYSEVTYVFLRLSTDKKSFELKNLPELIKSKSSELKKVTSLLDIADNLPITNTVEKTSIDLMKKYGLLPNDVSSQPPVNTMG